MEEQDEPSGPKLVAEAPSYLVVYKPSRMHSAPLHGPGGTLLDFAAGPYPEVRIPRGSKDIEGGLLHRLDYETRGLLLIARTQRALDDFLDQQRNNRIVKDYMAVSVGADSGLPGFPPCPFSIESGQAVIESAFRPYGAGRKAVRPLVDARRTAYRTEIVSCLEDDGQSCFHIRITRGFRHQIRCHLAWIGCPIRGDRLYGGGAGVLSLAAVGLSFTDPDTGKRVNMRCRTDTGLMFT